MHKGPLSTPKHVSAEGYLSAAETVAESSRYAYGGFTLIELLAVMVIILILLALVVPATSTIFKGTQLTQASDLLTSQLTLARQEALTRNQTVEVRLYRYAPLGTTSYYCAIQCFALSDSNTYVPLEKVELLPTGIALDAGSASAATTLSSILSSATSSTSVPALVPGSTLKVQLPQLPQPGTQYNAATFQFYRDGSTNLLSTGGPWFLTLHNFNDGDALTTAPHNFCTVQIDPTNGTLHTFRP